jgi:hypothetical protein
MHYIQLRQFLSSSDDDLTNRFTTLIETVVLCDSFAGVARLGMCNTPPIMENFRFFPAEKKFFLRSLQGCQIQI